MATTLWSTAMGNWCGTNSNPRTAHRMLSKGCPHSRSQLQGCNPKVDGGVAAANMVMRDTLEVLSTACVGGIKIGVR